jgi:tRNA 2-thiouridine synthesizing protein A
MATITLDLAGLKCPLPVLRTKKALASMQVGDVLEVLCTDPMAVIDIPHMVQQTGNHLVQMNRSDTKIRFSIRKESI